jgi:Zn-dependent M28 family amino/carboxypeptidase
MGGDLGLQRRIGWWALTRRPHAAGLAYRRTTGLLLCLSLSWSVAQAQGPADGVARAVKPSVLRSHLEFLASDALEGRGTGQRGGMLAAIYIAAQFARLGLEPAGDSGTYYQVIPLRGDSYSPQLSPSGGPPLELGKDFVAYLTGPRDSVSFTADAVFVGYGITAPEEHWDDYAGADVRGKVVLALAGTPADRDSTQFRNPKRDDYGFRQYKVDEGTRHGAAAVFVIYRQPLPAPWEAIATSWLGQQVQLPDSAEPAPSLGGWINTPAAGQLLERAGEKLEALAGAAAHQGFPARPLRLALSVTVVRRPHLVRTANVLARLRGHGPSAKEVVLLGAHYDHLGIGPAVAGDSIYNGALDNASGTAGMLAIAEACVASRLEPGRSIVFAAFGAEEAGLLGSETLVRKPPVPVTRIAAMLNLDGLNVITDTKDIAALGADWSSLGAPFQSAAAMEGYSITPADSPIMQEAVAQDFFNRSDQAPFARAGVPALFLYFGSQVTASEAGLTAKQMLDDYLDRRYHRPNDDLSQPLDYQAGAHTLRVFARTLVSVANAPQAPQWKSGAPYKR